MRESCTLRLTILLLCSVALFGLACEQKQPSESEETKDSGTFGLLQQKIFDQHCATSGCHNSVSKAGGMALRGSESYSNLINVQPNNTAARNAGILRVKPSDAEKSFLYLKTGQSLNTEYGDRMPQNSTLGLSASAREFIRQWIAAGASQTAEVADARLLDQPIVTTDPFTPPDPPAQGMQLRVYPFVVNSREEREIFVYSRLQNTDTLYVRGVDIKMREGSHHFILYKYSAADLPSGQVRDFNNTTLFQEMFRSSARVFLIGSQTPTMSYDLPENVVFPLEPLQGFDLNSHYVNNSSTGVSGEVYVNLRTVPKSSAYKIAQPIFDNFTNILIPKKQKSNILRMVTFDTTRYVFMLTSHTHKRGESFKIFLVGGPEDGKLVYENYTWDHPTTRTFSPPLRFERGWGYRIEAVYNNDTDRDIRFGFTSEDEMCIVIGYYYR